MISKNRWRAGGFVWSADITADHSADSGFRGPVQTGTLHLSLSFAKKTSGLVVAALVLESVGELRIDTRGGVALADEIYAQ